MRRISYLVSSTILATSVAVVGPAFAQEAPALQAAAPTTGSSNAPEGLEEVVVTAQRRDEPLQAVPIAISTISADKLQIQNINNIDTLQGKVASLNVQNSGGQPVMYIRGVGQNAGGPNNENSVSTYVDDVYLGIGPMTLLEFNNIQQLTVLKGPQGTLFGRNATGGIFLVTTADPKQGAAFDAGVGYGNYNAVTGSFYGTAGVTDDLAINLSTLYDNQVDGWGHNFYTGEATYRQVRLSLRAKALYTPTDSTEIRLSVDYNYSNSAGVDFQPGPGNINYRLGLVPNGLGPYDLYMFPGDNYIDVQGGGASIKVNQDLGFANLVDITAFRTVTQHKNNNETGGNAPLPTVNYIAGGDQFTQEVQLLSEADSKLKWQVGTFYLHSNPNFSQISLTGLGIGPTSGANQNGQQVNDSVSVYEQATYPIFDGTNLTEGLRYTIENQDLVDCYKILYNGKVTHFPDKSQGFDKLTWRFSVDQKLTEDIMAYASYNRGVKSGGFNLSSPTAAGYAPEKLDAYEVGLKTEFLDHRLRLNLAGFYYDYSNIQVNQSAVGVAIVTNAAKAQESGFDADAEFRVSRNFKISGNLAYLNAYYTKYPNAVVYSDTGVQLGGAAGFNATGSATPFSPSVTGSITGEYTIESRFGPFFLSADVDYYGGAYSTPGSVVKLPAFTQFNASARWMAPSGAEEVRLWAANLTNAKNIIYATTLPTIGLIQARGAPATFGVNFTYHYD